MSYRPPLPDSDMLSERRGIEARLGVENRILLERLREAQDARDDATVEARKWRHRYYELAALVGIRPEEDSDVVG